MQTDVLAFDERRSDAVDAMLARALPALPQLQELSIQDLQLARADGVAVLTAATALTALSLFDLVLTNDTAARRFVPTILQLCLTPHEWLWCLYQMIGLQGRHL